MSIRAQLREALRPLQEAREEEESPRLHRRRPRLPPHPPPPPHPPQVLVGAITSTSLDATARPAPTREVFCTCCGSMQTPWTKGCPWAL